MLSRTGESTSNCYENGSTSTENKQVTEQCLRRLRPLDFVRSFRLAIDLRIYACGAIREESIYSDLVSGTLQLIASTMNLLKLRGIFSALTNGRRIWFWYVAVAIAVTLPVQIHRSAVRYQAIYGKTDAMTKAAREAALEDIITWISSVQGWSVTGHMGSPLEGGDGNMEFLVAARKS